MVVVSDTSPLTNLAAIGRFDLLRSLFEEIHIADGVWAELNAGGRVHPGSQEVSASLWIHRHEATNQSLVRALQRDLDTGEAETLALAVELDATVILLDEREARRAALRLGLRPLGVLGILLRAKELGLMKAVGPALDALRQQAGFYVSELLAQSVLSAAGELDCEAGR